MEEIKMSIDVEFGRLIAEGGYGRVYTCTTEGYEDSVFKIFYVRDLLLPCIELDCMFRIQHPNLMKAKNIYTIRTLPPKKLKEDKEVTLYKDGSGKYIVIEMERAKGDLFDWKKENHTFEEKVKVFWKILEGMEFFHKCHLLHLDIKTENILMMEDGSPKITDFGLVVPLTNHSRGRRYTREMITKNYRPPENIEEKAKDKGKKKKGFIKKDIYYYQQKSDIWSLGVLFAEILMPYKNGYFIEDNQVKTIPFLLSEKNHKNFIFSKIGRGLTLEQKEQVYPVLAKMLKINIDERADLKTIMGMKLFKQFGLEYKDRAEGNILQPDFPPPLTQADLDGDNDDVLTIEDYPLKLEYFLYQLTKMIFYIMKHWKETFPLQMIFVAVDIFLRHRHFYETSDDLMAISIFCATQMCCEYEIEIQELEEWLEIEDLERKWRDFLFLYQGSERCIFLPLTPFSKATCECRLNRLVELIYTKPEEYIELLQQENYEEMDEWKTCKKKPGWNLNQWKDKIDEYMRENFQLNLG